MKRLFAAACLMAICLLSGFQARGQDEQYIRIYGIIQEGDSLLNAQQPAKALAKYTEAQGLLQQFQRTYPDWNNSVVKYRLSYLGASISEITKRFPNAAQEATKPVPKANGSLLTKPEAGVPGELENQVNALQNEIRSLQNDRSLLEAKLREAMRVQPTATDPRALAKAEEEITRLQKENSLLNVALSQRPAQPVPAADSKAVDQLKTQLAEATRKLGEETERSKTLAADKAVLQKKLADVPKEWNATSAEDTRKALEESNRHLAEQMEMNNRLSLEKTALQNRIKALASDSEALAALRSENEILKKQLADIKAAPPVQDDKAVRELAEVKAQMAVLKSDQNVLRLEKVALEKRIKEMAVAKTAPTPTASPADTDRVKQLESERDDLRNKLDAAQKEIAAAKSKNSSAQVEDLKNQIEILRTRLAVMEVQQVPMSEEEAALLKKPESQPADSKPKLSSKDLPSGAMTLVAEAQKDFAARRFNQAEEKYQQVLKQDDKNVYTLANLAAIQLEMNKLDEAEKNIQQALSVAPDDAYTLSLLGFLKFRQNKMDEALEALGRAAKLDPKNAEVQNYLGLVLSQKGMRKAAESALRRAITLDPNYASAHYNLAVIYVTQRPPDVELARFHYQKALAAGLPANPDMEKMLSRTVEVAP